MTWEDLEDYLTSDWDNEPFTARKLAVNLGISTKQGSRMIQSYLNAQRDPNRNTACFLYREGRTAGAVWHVGYKLNDARRVAGMGKDDLRCKVVRAIVPDLENIANHNPRIKRRLDSIITLFINQLDLLEMSLEDV